MAEAVVITPAIVTSVIVAEITVTATIVNEIEIIGIVPTIVSDEMIETIVIATGIIVNAITDLSLHPDAMPIKAEATIKAPAAECDIFQYFFSNFPSSKKHKEYKL